MTDKEAKIIPLDEGQLVSSRSPIHPIIPTSLSECMDMANMVAGARMAPKGLEKPEALAAVFLKGLELGLPPMASMQYLANINGRVSVFGAGALALVKGKADYGQLREWFEDTDGNQYDDLPADVPIEELTACCYAERRGEQGKVFKFDVARAKKAKLWGKSGPWQEYPDRMLKARARGFALQDTWPHHLGGLALAEADQDFGITVSVEPTKQIEQNKPSAKELVARKAGKIKKEKKPENEPVKEEKENNILQSVLDSIEGATDMDALSAIGDHAKSVLTDKNDIESARRAWVRRRDDLVVESQPEPTEASVTRMFKNAKNEGEYIEAQKALATLDGAFVAELAMDDAKKRLKL